MVTLTGSVRARLRWAFAALPFVAAALAAEHYVQGIVAYMVTMRPDIVDFNVYYRAAQAVASGRDPYRPFTGCCFDPAAMDGYTYPPVLAVVLSPLTALPIGVVGRLFFGVSQLCLVGAIVVAQRTLRGALSRATQVWLLAAVLLFQPIHAGNFGIQVDNILLLAFAVAAWSYTHRRGGALAGVAIGLVTALKVAPAQMAAALVVDAQRRVIVSIAGFALATAVPLLLVWPAVAATPRYFTQVLPTFSGGVALTYNRSLPGVVLQTFVATGRTPPSALVLLFHALQIGGVVLTWFVCRRSTSTFAGRAATFAAFLAVMPITSPVTWDHHQASDALAFVLLAPALQRSGRGWVAAAGAMALMSVNELILASMVQSAGFGHPQGFAIAVYAGAASVNLVGMMLLYGVALQLAWAQRDAPPRAARYRRAGWRTVTPVAALREG